VGDVDVEGVKTEGDDAQKEVKVLQIKERN
jgi:hypothetical protein